MSIFAGKGGEGEIFWWGFGMNHNLLKQERIPASISDNDYACECFCFLKLSVTYDLEIIHMSLLLALLLSFWLAEQNTVAE